MGSLVAGMLGGELDGELGQEAKGEHGGRFGEFGGVGSFSGEALKVLGDGAASKVLGDGAALKVLGDGAALKVLGDGAVPKDLGDSAAPGKARRAFGVAKLVLSSMGLGLATYGPALAGVVIAGAILYATTVGKQISHNWELRVDDVQDSVGASLVAAGTKIMERARRHP